MSNRVESLEVIAKSIFNISRSVTGEGQLKTLEVLKKHIHSLNIQSFATGQDVFGWPIPNAWDFESLKIYDKDGTVVLEDQGNSLRVINHSTPVDKTLYFDELRPHLHTSVNTPNTVPYLTSYYNKNWGICLSQTELNKLKKEKGPLTVNIASSFRAGYLYIGEIYIQGQSDTEILISTYICHPNLANDNLSGILCALTLAQDLQLRKNYFSIRILFLPETIGPIAYATKNKIKLEKAAYGFVLTTCGGKNELSIKRSFNKENTINAMAEMVLFESGLDYKIYDFDYHGSDERQYSSPGLRLNCISYCFDKYYTYPEYHSSADTLELLSFENILDIGSFYIRLIEKLEDYPIYISTQKFGEPFLSKHDLYNSLGGSYRANQFSIELDTVLGLLFWSDGTRSTYEIAKKLSISGEEAKQFSKYLNKIGLLRLI